MFSYLWAQVLKPLSLRDWIKTVIFSFASYFFWGFIYCDFFYGCDGTNVLRWILKAGFLIDMFWVYYLFSSGANEKSGASEKSGTNVPDARGMCDDNVPEPADKESRVTQITTKGLSNVMSRISNCIANKSKNLETMNDDIITDPTLIHADDTQNDSTEIDHTNSIGEELVDILVN